MEEVFSLGSGGSVLVIQHSINYGELTIIAVLIILIFVALMSNENRTKA